MENLFDLDDYDESKEVNQNKEEKKSPQDIQETFLPQQADPNIATTIDAEIELNQPEGSNILVPVLDDDFKDKGDSITITSTKSSAVRANFHATDDVINIGEFDKIPNIAMTFPFELDTFQKRSIIRLENHQNVLVCAHTSSGKTVVAEYAIALAKKNGKRAFYTSPIKALSNQKYREFKKKFDDVGILTGDVSIKPDAQCLIMTTEILQSLLYKASEMLNLVEWIIFDEVHYINDTERGHVWEEILILLPPSIGIVMLSATVPNYLEFAKWVGRIKNTPIYIQNTLKRVVPLEHKIFVGTKKVFLAKDKFDKILEDKINEAIQFIKDTTEKQLKSKPSVISQKERKEREQKLLNQIRAYNDLTGKKEMAKFNKGGNQGQGNKITLTHLKLEEIVNYLFQNNLTPAVIFVFSIKKIEEYARMISGNIKVDKAQSSKIIKFFDKCMSKLSDEDQQIPQIQLMRKMLPTGIGVHHAGLLPILKETIEILYSKGLLTILFATTSFSIGLNMPTRTVVFTDITKYNEEKKEILSSSEYLQMCGRAGRRGIDELGNVFILMGDKPNPPLASDISNMMGGSGTLVESKFRLSYRTIISFLSRNIKNIVEFFKESYLENANLMTMPQVMKEINELKMKLIQTERVQCKYIDGDDYIRQYYNEMNQLKSVREELFFIRAIYNKLTTPGRAIIYNSKKTMKDIVVIIIKYYPELNGEIWCLTGETNIANNTIQYEDKNPNSGSFANSGVIHGKQYKYFSIFADEIVDILDYNVKIDTNLHCDSDTEGYLFIKPKEMDRVLNEIILLNSKTDLKIFDYNKLNKNDISSFELVKKKTALQTNILNIKCHDCYLRTQHWKQFEQRKNLQDSFDQKSSFLKQENLKYYDEFVTRLQILKQMEYITDDHQLLLKGKAAREISTSDCIIITELLMSNVLEKLEIDEIVGFLSGFAYSKNEIEFKDPEISPNFTSAFEEFKAIYEGLVELEKKFNFEESKYNRRITFAISKPLQLWIQGKPFYEILSETELEEGKLYSLIMRLFLFLDEIKNFYETLGNEKLVEKFTAAKGKLMRDIISCKSLYLQEDIDIDDI